MDKFVDDLPSPHLNLYSPSEEEQRREIPEVCIVHDKRCRHQLEHVKNTWKRQRKTTKGKYLAPLSLFDTRYFLTVLCTCSDGNGEIYFGRSQYHLSVLFTWTKFTIGLLNV